MATTSPDNLWSPDGTDDYDFTIDAAAMQGSVQAALTSIRSRVRYFVGTNAARIAATAVEGDIWYANDTNIEWFYNGSAWVRTHGLFVVKRANAQPLTGGWNVVNAAYGTPINDGIGTFSGGVFTATAAGRYRISANVSLTSSSSPLAMQITKNSASPDGTTSMATSFVGTGNALTLSTVEVLAANDAIRVLVYTLAANSIDTTGNRGVQLSVELIRG